MHNNAGIEKRCLNLWFEVVSALESRVSSVNQYVPEANSRIACELLKGDAVEIKQPAAQRSLVASLDLKAHAIQLNRCEGSAAEQRVSELAMPLSMLADGELYVTDGHQLLGDATEVAKFLMAALLGQATTATA